MVFIIKKGATKKELRTLEKKLSSLSKGFDSDKFNGAIKKRNQKNSILKP